MSKFVLSHLSFGDPVYFKLDGSHDLFRGSYGGRVANKVHIKNIQLVSYCDGNSDFHSGTNKWIDTELFSVINSVIGEYEVSDSLVECDFNKLISRLYLNIDKVLTGLITNSKHKQHLLDEIMRSIQYDQSIKEMFDNE
jgi:hypothetical protein